MKNTKCIIFDCDGVLVDSEAIGHSILLSMAAEHGLNMTMEQAIKEFNGRGLKDCFQQIEKIVGKKLPGDFETIYRQRTFKAFSTQLKPINGAIAFVNSLSISYCVASSGPLEKIRLGLTATGMLSQFENKMFSSYQINSWKLNPEIFLFAAREMGFLVSECVVIEDSVAGVIAAVTGGFKVFGFANELTAEALVNEGAIVFYNFEELSKMLGAF